MLRTLLPMEIILPPTRGVHFRVHQGQPPLLQRHWLQIHPTDGDLHSTLRRAFHLRIAPGLARYLWLSAPRVMPARIQSCLSSGVFWKFASEEQRDPLLLPWSACGQNERVVPDRWTLRESAPGYRNALA
jgi:hypothetical protein